MRTLILALNTLLNVFSKGFLYLTALEALVPAQFWGFIQASILLSLLGFAIFLIIKLIDIIV